MKSEVKKQVVKWSSTQRSKVLENIIQVYRIGNPNKLRHCIIVHQAQLDAFLPTYPDKVRSIKSILTEKEFSKKFIIKMINEHLAKFNDHGPSELKDRFLKILDQPILPEEKVISLPVSENLLDINVLTHALVEGITTGVDKAVEKVVERSLEPVVAEIISNLTKTCEDRTQVAQKLIKHFESRLDQGIIALLTKAQNKIDISFRAFEQLLEEQVEVLSAPKSIPEEIIESIVTSLIEEKRTEEPTPPVENTQNVKRLKVGIWGPFAVEQHKVREDLKDLNLKFYFYSDDSSHKRTAEPSRYLDYTFYLCKQAAHSNTEKVTSLYPDIVKVGGGITNLIKVIRETIKK